MTTMQTVYPESRKGFLSGNTPSHGSFVKGQQGIVASRLRCMIKGNGSTLLMAGLLMGCVFIAPTFGVAVEDLKAPIKDLKETIFGGWMWVPKIGAAVGGCLLAVYNQSIMPLATGAGVGLGIHFYDLYIKADGALI
jgi:hypothetical protein